MGAMLLVKNRRALFDHQLLSKYSAGVVLYGYEVKALREKKASFEGSFVQIIKGSPVVINMHIGDYSKKSQKSDTTENKRTRKLLLTKKEIEEIERELSQKGRTAVPLALVLANNLIKLEFAVVKGKKDFEKKQTAKEKQVKKDMERDLKDFRRSSDV